MRLQGMRAVVLACALAAVSCARVELPPEEEGVFMAHGTHSLRDPGMAALLRGRLDVRDGCLVVVGSGWFKDDPVLVVWAREYALRRDGDRLRIFEGDRPIVAVGDQVDVGGGEVEADRIARWTASQIPDACQAPKYYVGNVTKPSP